MSLCQRCDRWFASSRALEQHLENSSLHHYCRQHRKDFTSRHGLIEHWKQSPYHNYCDHCDEHFSSTEDLDDHDVDEHFVCPDCDTVFYNEIGLREHQRQAHFIQTWYCGDCQRSFSSQHNYDAHRKSSVHVGRTIVCPFAECNQRFPNLAALFAHVESNRCPSGATRDMLNRRVVDMDRHNVITNRQRLLQWPGGSYEPPASTSSWATERSWNGTAYECFLCHRNFVTLHSLNTHLQSPKHQDRIYYCPGCQEDFVSLSGLTQHVESDKCGVRRFKQVQHVMEGLNRNLRLLGM